MRERKKERKEKRNIDKQRERKEGRKMEEKQKRGEISLSGSAKSGGVAATQGERKREKEDEKKKKKHKNEREKAMKRRNIQAKTRCRKHFKSFCCGESYSRRPASDSVLMWGT